MLGVLLLVGVPLTSALLFTALLACRLMMFAVGGQGGQGGGGMTTRRGNQPDESID